MLMRSAWSHAIAVAGLVLAACTNLEAPTDATQPQLVVHAVLDVNAPGQIILISRARTGQSVITGAISDDEPVSGAVVTITDPNGAVLTAQELNTSRGVYVVTGQVISPSARYTLFVRTPEGEQVSGTTAVPAVPPSVIAVPLAPTDTFFRVRDTLRLLWPSIPGARNYEVLLRSSRSDVEYRTFTDTNAIALPGTTLTIGGKMAFPPRARVDVLVSAVDANYYDYYRAQSDPFAGAAPSHLTGAVGVFGSTGAVMLTSLRVR
jgi:uncharacterized protein DUF4249